MTVVGLRKIVVHLTYRCRLSCQWCDRMLDKLNIENGDLSRKQARHFVRTVMDSNWPLSLIRIAGGEPQEHPDFHRMMLIFQTLTSKYKVRVSTNGLQPPPHIRGIHWRVWHGPDKNHTPFMISPWDLGIMPYRYGCAMPVTCGVCYDYRGWSFCSVGTVISKAIGPDVHSSLPVYPEPMPAICQHCIYTLPRNVQYAIQLAAMRGHVKLPTRTYRRMLHRMARRGHVKEKSYPCAAINYGCSDALMESVICESQCEAFMRSNTAEARIQREPNHD